MSAFYQNMQGVATRLLGKFQQGVVSLRREAITPGPNPWDPPTRTATDYPLFAVVKRLHQRYENGALIVETGDQVYFAVPSVVPALGDKLVINGKARPLTNLTPIPPSGVVAVYKAWCAGS